MRGRKDSALVVIAALALLSLAAATAIAATVTQEITYQGKLTDAAGSPRTGAYSVTFRLYETATGGTALAASTETITATNGLFTTPVSFDKKFFDGRGLWLGIKAGSDPEMTPRQEIRPVPYALGLRPGAWITGSDTLPTLTLLNKGGGRALNVSTQGDDCTGISVSTKGQNSDGIVSVTTQQGSEGVYAQTFGQHSHGVNVSTAGDHSLGVVARTYGNLSGGMGALTHGASSQGVYAVTLGANSEGVKAETYGASSKGVVAKTEGTNSEGMFAWTEGDGSPGVYASTSGVYSPGIYGVSFMDAGIQGKGKTGGYFTTNSAGSGWNDIRAGVDVSTIYTYNPAVRTTTSSDYSYGMVAMTGGDYSRGVSVGTNGDFSEGVAALTYGDSSQGVVAVTEGDNSEGVHAWTRGADSEGMRAETNGAFSEGVYAYTSGANSPGIYAESLRDVGVYGMGKEGGYFTTNQGGTDWWTNRRPAINVSTKYPVNPGITIDTAQSVSPGAYSTTHGDSSQGFATMTYGSGSPGLNAYTTGPGSYGVDATSAQSYGVYGHTGRSDQRYGIYTPDYLWAKGTQFPLADVAEFMPVTGDAPPGTVLVIGPEGWLEPSASAYDLRVIGIVSTDPGVTLGTKEGGNPGEAQVAVAGRVPCKVDASYGAIRPGDILTSSPTPGHAMKAEPVNIGGVEIYRPGTVLGKAMESLESGTGTIDVVVALQ